jgi:subtilase-type serine protease
MACMQASFALSDTWIDFEDRGSSGEARGLAGALYLAHLDPRLRIAASLGYGHDWNESERVIQFGAIDRVAQADAGSDRFFGSVNGAYALLRQDGWTADAIADLSAIRLASEDFEETGAGSLSLSVEDRTRSSVRSEIGLAVARTVALSDDRSATPHLTIGWAHEFLDEGAEITSAFSGLGSTFAVEGADEPRDRLLIGAGVRLEQSNGAVLSLGYEGEIAADRVESSVRLSLAIRL